MLKQGSLNFNPVYVDPFYGGLMNANFVREEIVSDPIIFLKSVKRLRLKLANKEILTLLNDSWRPSKVGAWVIGLCRINELKIHLIEYLNNQPIYCEHVIINLALFNSDDGNIGINNFLSNQLKVILDYTKNGEEYKAIDVFERNSILWAFKAIEYLDLVNSTRNYKKLINSDIWNEIKKE